MAPASSIPRFLLPQTGALWRTRVSTSSPISTTIRHASKAPPKKVVKPSAGKPSSKPPSKPLVLEKPTKFNPPSHGARLRKEAPRYPGPQLSAEEETAQRTKKYPNMMAPEGSFMHWFINNKSIHIYISLVRISSCTFSNQSSDLR